MISKQTFHRVNKAIMKSPAIDILFDRMPIREKVSFFGTLSLLRVISVTEEDYARMAEYMYEQSIKRHRWDWEK